MRFFNNDSNRSDTLDWYKHNNKELGELVINLKEQIKVLETQLKQSYSLQQISINDITHESEFLIFYKLDDLYYRYSVPFNSYRLSTVKVLCTNIEGNNKWGLYELNSLDNTIISKLFNPPGFCSKQEILDYLLKSSILIRKN